MPLFEGSRTNVGDARLKIGLCIAVLAAIAIFSFLQRKKPAPVALPERFSSELALRDGRLYVTNQTVPFTGLLVEHYADGALKSRSTVMDGRLNGVSEGWHTNGQMQVREFFTNGVSHGFREKWYPNGGKLSEGEIISGKHEGIFRRWHENGKLAEEVSMRNGEPEGLSSSFYPSGYLKTQVTMRDGKAVEQKSWKDGDVLLAGTTNAPPDKTRAP